ncbi:hypothetical protein PG997_000267 [Apiospora hydei]|uniref:2EXR domain-containing protein n=1 Tax=Apiospora hydei TaxID=1337664 RepID=A0ABR1XAA4_9PEZI
MADDGSTSGNDAVVEIIRALDRFVLFSYLPTELRWMIYDMMLRITRGPQSFLYFPNGYTFVTGLDFGLPLLATVCHDMYHYVVHHSRFQRIPFVQNPYPRPYFNLINPSHRRRGWFSARHDTVELESVDHVEWIMKDIWTLGPGGPYVGHVVKMARTTPYFLLPCPPAYLQNALHRELNAQIDDVVQNDQQDAQEDVQESARQGWVHFWPDPRGFLRTRPERYTHTRRRRETRGCREMFWEEEYQ